MKIWRVTLTGLLVIACTTLLVTPLSAGGGSGGGSGQGGSGMSQGGGPAGVMGESRTMGREREREQEQKRVATRQREQVRDCQNSAERVRNQIREMAQLTKGKSLDAGKAEMQVNALRNEVRSMEEEHARFMAGLDREDREQLQERLTVMDRERERVRECLQNMDDELNKNSPDAARIEEQTREMERAMNTWEEQYGQAD